MNRQTNIRVEHKDFRGFAETSDISTKPGGPPHSQDPNREPYSGTCRPVRSLRAMLDRPAHPLTHVIGLLVGVWAPLAQLIFIPHPALVCRGFRRNLCSKWSGAWAQF